MVNLAAQAGVRYSIDHPDVYIESNLIGFFNILEGIFLAIGAFYLIAFIVDSIYDAIITSKENKKAKRARKQEAAAQA